MFGRRRQSDEDFGEEIRAHIEIEADRLREQGVPADEAEAAARRAFGNVTSVRERFYETNRWVFFDQLAQDLGYAIRVLRQSPGFTATAIVSLALGIGANTAIFSLIDAALLRYLPVRAPQELVQFSGGGSFSNYEYQSFQKFDGMFSGILASGGADARDVSIGNGSAERAKVSIVSGNYFQLLGVDAAAGRLFGPMDDAAGAAPVAAISYSYWRQRFALDPAAIGATVRIGKGVFTVAGVAAKSFFGEEVGQSPDFWTPLNTQPLVIPGHQWLSAPNTHWLVLMARLKPGVSAVRVGAAVTALKNRLDIERAGAEATPAFLREVERESISMEPASKGLSRMRGTLAQPLWVLMAVAALVLLIACANVANLLLARGSARQREIGVRLALGASRGRVMRQLLTESLVLAACGGALGVGIAAVTSRALLHLASTDGDPVALQVGPDPRVLGFAFALSVLTGIVFGLAPAWRAARQDLNPSLNGNRQGTGRATRSRVAPALVAAQVALSVVILMSAGLLLGTLRNLRHIDTGMTPERLLVVDIDPRSAGYTERACISLCGRLVTRVAALPGVNSVTFSENGLFTGRNSNNNLRVEGEAARGGGKDEAFYDTVGPKYFATLGIRILRGRDFDERDRAGAEPVTVINEEAAKHWFGGADPLGRWVRAGKESLKIVGVARDVRDNSLRGGINRYYYVPYLQHPESNPFTVRLMVRTAADPARLTALIRQTVRAEDKALPILSTATAMDLIDRTIVQERLIATLSGWFAVLAVGLAAVGLYGVMAYRVVRRTGEIGIRMALGAEGGSVRRMILGESLALVLVGVAVGVPLAIAACRALRSLLYGLSAADFPTIAFSAVGIVGAGLLAGWIPARRASRIDPMNALKYE